MATATASANPVSDLEYDWLTVLQSKAEGLNAYEKYIKDAEQANATECVEMFRKLQEKDAEMVKEIRDHMKMMMSKSQGQVNRVGGGPCRRAGVDSRVSPPRAPRPGRRTSRRRGGRAAPRPCGPPPRRRRSGRGRRRCRWGPTGESSADGKTTP